MVDANLSKIEDEIAPRHVRFYNEPSLGLSDNDFVHRMWDADEVLDPTDEDSEDDSIDDEEDVELQSDSDWDSDASEQPS